MKIALFYFSGTNNTNRVILKWQLEASKHDIQIDLYSIEKNEVPTLGHYDKIGFAYPIHAFNAPKIVNEFAKKLPKLNKVTPLFIIMVSGEYLNLNHSSGNKLSRILKRRNIILESDYHYVMPYNLVFRHTEQRAYKMDEAMNRIVPLDVMEYLVDSKPHHTKKLHLVGWFIWLIRIEQWFAHVNGKHYKVDTSKCIKCMKCINECPTHNITYQNDKFIFSNKCVACMRCAFNCPKDAFKIGLLNSWRVNKPYAFKDIEKNERDKHPRYCKRSYHRYFNEIEARLINYERE